MEWVIGAFMLWVLTRNLEIDGADEDAGFDPQE